jgi:hypothetical protein
MSYKRELSENIKKGNQKKKLKNLLSLEKMKY